MSDPIALIGDWLKSLLIGWGLSSEWVTVILAALGGIVIVSVTLVIGIALVWVERKVVARFQDRVGPNRVGPKGLIQPFADILKLLIKEDTTPEGADKIVFNIAPVLAIASVILIWGVVPFAPAVFGTDVNVGVLYIVAVGSLGTLGILMAGWSSNNKYALLGAFRTVAQLVSYEIPLVLALLVPVLLAREMGVNGIVQAQNSWFILLSPIGALIFFISSLAEIGRSPFDLLEAESEIVAGYHVEYSGMKFGLFYAGELIHAFTISALTATLFLGGWRGPGVDQIPILGVLYLLIKSGIVYFVVMWIRYSMPRIRIDHMLSFNWKFLTPLALTLLVVTAVVDKIVSEADATSIVRIASHIGANVAILIVTIFFLRAFGRRRQKQLQVFEPRPVAVPPKS